MFGFHKCGLIQWLAVMANPFPFLIDKKSFLFVGLNLKAIKKLTLRNHTRI
jgi:hypothetical protein